MFAGGKMKAGVVVIGGGPAGLAASLKASEYTDVMLLERHELGGILQQCIHDGFGNFIFGKMLTGPEYAEYFIGRVRDAGVDIRVGTTVLQVEGKKIVASGSDGILEIETKAIVLAMGCRERSRCQILIPGTRPAGIYTAGTAQRLINVEGVMPGRKVVILGSGDVGLMMARRLTLEGAEVEGVYEIMPKPGGLIRNVVQCLHDYNIPLHLCHTVVDIKGKKRLEGVVVAKVNEAMKPIKGTERFIPCDCLILAVGLIPENELSRQIGVAIDSRTQGPIVDERMETSVEGVFACGNVVHVHDLVDDVTIAGEIAGENAGKYAIGEFERIREAKVIAGENVRYVVPQILRGMEDVTFYLRVEKEMENVKLIVSGKKTFEKKYRIVRPAEMVKVKVNADILTSNEVRIDVKS